jgi:hypothetical protein
MMAPVIRVDEEVWNWLKANATPFEDTPNSVLRRFAGLESTTSLRARATAREDYAASSDGGDRSGLLDPFLHEFRGELSAKDGRVATWDGGGSRKTANLVEIRTASGRPSLLLYVKTRSEAGGFWGLRKNQLDSLRASGLKWLVALLIGPGQKGYLLSSELVDRAISEHRWSFGQAGDFKVHENREITGSRSFNSWKSLIASVIDEAA